MFCSAQLYCASLTLGTFLFQKNEILLVEEERDLFQGNNFQQTTISTEELNQNKKL